MNYGELKEQFTELLNRTDCTDTLVHTFLQQGFARIQRELRIPAMERHSFVTAEGTMNGMQIPSDLLTLKALIVGDTELEKLSIGALLKRTAYGSPRYFARIDNRFMFRPAIPTGSVVDVLYYGECGPLVSDSDFNELTVIAPDLCAYAALSYAGDFFEHDKRMEWESRYAQIRDELNGQALDEEFSGGPMVIQPAYGSDF